MFSHSLVHVNSPVLHDKLESTGRQVNNSRNMHKTQKCGGEVSNLVNKLETVKRDALKMGEKLEAMNYNLKTS